MTEYNVEKKENNISNIALFLFDVLLLPVHLIRLILIYMWGSKYNLKGFQFLDVIMHADNPYFNQEDCRMVNTMSKDYRIVIRDDSRIFPMDINNYFDKLPITNKTDIEDKIIIGSTLEKKMILLKI